jgi:exodeoxyribonuclease-3
MSSGLKIISWNVNGLRSVLKQGFLDYVKNEAPDILGLQEIKALPEQVELETLLPEYQIIWNSAERKGYSGTLILSRREPLGIRRGLNEPIADSEGRVLTIEYPDFYCVNLYVPNAQRELTRLDYKMDVWTPALSRHLLALEAHKPIVFMGDLNVAHQPIDLENPKSNAGNAGYTPEERDGFSELLALGYLDTFRVFYPDQRRAYSWWTWRQNARERNIGWRIDYVCVSAVLKNKIAEAFIHSHVTGSDHCPVGIVMEELS